MEGGSANDYEYCSADPINCNDLDGLKRRKLNPEEVQQEATIAGERLAMRLVSPQVAGHDPERALGDKAVDHVEQYRQVVGRQLADDGQAVAGPGGVYRRREGPRARGGAHARAAEEYAHNRYRRDAFSGLPGGESRPAESG